MVHADKHAGFSIMERRSERALGRNQAIRPCRPARVDGAHLNLEAENCKLMDGFGTAVDPSSCASLDHFFADADLAELYAPRQARDADFPNCLLALLLQLPLRRMSIAWIGLQHAHAIIF